MFPILTFDTKAKNVDTRIMSLPIDPNEGSGGEIPLRPVTGNTAVSNEIADKMVADRSLLLPPFGRGYKHDGGRVVMVFDIELKQFLLHEDLKEWRGKAELL